MINHRPQAVPVHPLRPEPARSAWLLGLVLGTVFHVEVEAQSCNPDVATSAPQSRFSVVGEVVTDLRTGLVWQRCPLGFAIADNGTSNVITDDRCEPIEDQDYTWQAALQSAGAVNQAGGLGGYTDWRLPNIKELLSIVERQCFFPALNVAVFPNPITQARSTYWSSSTADASNAYLLDFASGQTAMFPADRLTDTNLARLVR